jgi:hypothetical protein
MTDLENKILAALREKNKKMAEFDVECKKEHDKYMEQAKAAEAEGDMFWKKDYERTAEWHLSFQHHGYEFIDEWRNVIAIAMYGRIDNEWHSAVAGRHGTGHGPSISTELTHDERIKVSKVLNGLVKQGYLRPSKSGYKAKLVK